VGYFGIKCLIIEGGLGQVLLVFLHLGLGSFKVFELSKKVTLVLSGPLVKFLFFGHGL
jgi:hypothetical protein